MAVLLQSLSEFLIVCIVTIQEGNIMCNISQFANLFGHKNTLAPRK